MAIRFPLQVVKSITNTATTGTTNYDFFLPQDCDSIAVKLYTGTFTGTSPTLNVFVQTTDDGGTTWYDLIHLPQLVAAVTKNNANWATAGVSTGFSVASASGCSTLGVSGIGAVAAIPILSRNMRVAVIIGGTQVVNSGTEIRVYANSQSRAA